MSIAFNDLGFGSKMPQRSTLFSAGYDVFSSEEVVLKAKEVTNVTIPYSVSFDENRYEVLLFLRSSFGIKKNIRIYNLEKEEIVPFVELNSNKNYSVDLLNTNDEDVVLEKDTHFVQIVLVDKTLSNFPYELQVAKANDITPSNVSITDYGLKKSLISEEDLVLKVNESRVIASGYKALLEENTVLMGVIPFDEKRFALANSVAIIDKDYYGNEVNDGLMFFKIENRTRRNIVIKKGTPLVDLFSVGFSKADNEIVPKNARDGGIGSTSK